MSNRVISTVEQSAAAQDTLTLPHDERHIRRKRIITDSGEAMMVDLPKATHLHDGNVLRAHDGTGIRVVAAPEKLLRIRGQNQAHFAQLCWHIGNRHLPAQIDENTLFIQHDAVISSMLKGLGAAVEDVEMPFQPIAGAYHQHG